MTELEIITNISEKLDKTSKDVVESLIMQTNITLFYNLIFFGLILYGAYFCRKTLNDNNRDKDFDIVLKSCFWICIWVDLMLSSEIITIIINPMYYALKNLI